jgi:hypothetical protein
MRKNLTNKEINNATAWIFKDAGRFDRVSTPEKRITRIEISADGAEHWTLLSESVGIKVQ